MSVYNTTMVINISAPFLKHIYLRVCARPCQKIQWNFDWICRKSKNLTLSKLQPQTSELENSTKKSSTHDYDLQYL